MLAVARLHDPALRVGEVILIGGLGLSLGALGSGPRGFSPLFLLGRPLRQLGLILGHFRRRPGFGPRFNLCPRRRQLGLALLPPLHFLRNGQSFLQRRAVGLLGLGQQFFDLQLQLLDRLARVLITDRGVLAGVGQHLGPIHRHGDLAHLQKLQRLRQFQHPHEGLLQQRRVLPPEGADRVVVRMGIPARSSAPARCPRWLARCAGN